MEDLERFLDLVCRELDAHDAHLQLGGKDPTADGTVFLEIEPGIRLVVAFAVMPAEPARVRERLGALARTFDTTVAHAAQARRRVAHGPTRQSELTHALNVLAKRLDAAAVFILDERSPVLWGRSDAVSFVDDVVEAVDRGTGLADLPLPDDPDDRLRALVFLAAAAARKSQENLLHRTRDHGHAVRKFAGIYRLVAVFDHAFSPLHVQTTVSRALPAIERLVEGLPPVEPPPHRASVTPLRPV